MAAGIAKGSLLLLVSGAGAVVLLVGALWCRPPSTASVVWTGGDRRPVLLARGTPAPRFALPSIEGEIVDLAALKGRRLALVFVSPTCPHCDQLEQQMEAVVPAAAQRVFLISAGTREGARTIKATHPLAFPVLVDSCNAVGQEYKVSGVPAVYVLDVDGKVEVSAMGMPAAWAVVQQLQTDR